MLSALAKPSPPEAEGFEWGGLLLRQRKPQRYPRIGIVGREGGGDNRLGDNPVVESADVKARAQHIVGREFNGGQFLSCRRLVYIVLNFADNGSVVAYA